MHKTSHSFSCFTRTQPQNVFHSFPKVSQFSKVCGRSNNQPVCSRDSLPSLPFYCQVLLKPKRHCIFLHFQWKYLHNKSMCFLVSMGLNYWQILEFCYFSFQLVEGSFKLVVRILVVGNLEVFTRGYFTQGLKALCTNSVIPLNHPLKSIYILPVHTTCIYLSPPQVWAGHDKLLTIIYMGY